jgi:hypothetical protein
MGYYATSTEGNINIPYAQVSDLLTAIAEQYTAYKTSPWWNGETLDAPLHIDGLFLELDSAGFDYEDDKEYLCLITFDGKWRMWVEYLLRALMSVATSDSSMSFRGEDGEMWRFTQQGVQNAKIEWVDA